MSTKPKVLLLGSIDHEPAKEAYNALSSLAELTTTSATDPSEFLSECRRGALDGVKVIYRTFDSVSVTGKIEGEVVEALGKNGVGVKGICHNGAGYDQIDTSACTAAGIHVSNTPSAVDNATADTALYLLLSALRGFNAPLLSLRQKQWRGHPQPAPLGHDPQGKTLGILGMGGIGKNLARKAEALGMNIVYHNRWKMKEEEESGGARYVGFEELLRESDVVSVNLPLNKQTHHLLSTPQFALMKPSSILINTARGAVIDEAALVTALNNNTIASAGLDVYEDEPSIHPGLLDDERVTLLPHLGTWTVETQTKMELWTIENVRDMLVRARLKSRVPEQEDMPY